jgi:hypothetical protein
VSIRKAVLTPLEVATLCWGLLLSAGCNSATPSINNGVGIPTGPNALPRVDWGRLLLAGGTAGIGQFPAKFTFDANAAPDCTNDFVAYNTSLTGVSATVATSGNLNFTGQPIAGQTVTFTSPETSLTLTASNSLNSGLFFLIGGTTAATATNLAAAITTNGAGVGITGTPSGSMVITSALAKGAEGNLLNFTTTLSNFGLSAGGTAGVGVGNIVAFNQLYSTQGSAAGLCNKDGPSVYWSYFTGTGQALTSIVLSLDGTKVAFVENAAGGATLDILKWKAGEGTGAGYPVAPTTTLLASQSWSANCPAANSCISRIAFNGAFQDAGSAPFYDYATDALYVGDNSGRVHKFTGVFLGAPAEVLVSWPIIVNVGAALTGPIYDGVSGNIFVGDNTGRLSFIQEIGSTVGGATPCSPFPCLNTVNLAVGAGGAIADSPVVDGTNGTVIAINGTDTTNNGTILQASTGLAGAVSFKIGGATSPGSQIYSGAFDNTYFTSAKPNIAGHMYVCGKDSANGNRPAVYQLSFAAVTATLTGVGTALTGLASADGEACSAVTEIDNPNGGGAGIERDWIFFSIGNSANTANPIPAASGCRAANQGCVISIDVTGNPTWPPTTVTNAVSVRTNAAGGTSGMIVDNVSTAAQTSNIYFSLGGNSTGLGPGLPSCNITANIGCALKLTQSGLI